MTLAPDQERKRKQILERARQEPVWWVREVLGRNPWPAQRQILESVRDNDRTAIRSCHGAGKSFCAADCGLWFLMCHPDSIVATTAPTFRQVEKILWQEIRAAHSKSARPLGGEPLLTQLKLRDKWFAFGFSTDDPDAFQGLHSEHVLVVFDEAAGIDANIWEAADGVLSSAHCRFLAIGNPTQGSGPFFNEFRSSGTNTLKISAFDTPNFTAFGIRQEHIQDGSWESKIDKPLPYPTLVTPHWVADKYRKWGPSSPMYQSRVLAEFPDAAADALVPLSWVEAAHHRTLEPTKPNELGVDVARTGKNATVIAHRRGPVVRVIRKIRGADTMRVSGEVAHAIKTTGAELVKVDADGLGAGVYDRCKEQGLPVIEFRGGQKPRDPDRFVNLRAEVYWTLRERLDPKSTEPIDLDADQELAAQLTALRYKLDSKGRVLIESKDDMAKRGIASPDEADAVAMALGDPKGRRPVTLGGINPDAGYVGNKWRI